MTLNPEILPVCQVKDIQKQSSQQAWLIRSLWSHAAVGVIGGAPKCCKSWLGLDMAVSVASKTPCVGMFEVECSGRALVYLAEDAVHEVRARIDSICRHRSLDIAQLDLFVITAPSLRLDLAHDQQLLEATLQKMQPKLLILDPLVRLHHLDENSASDVSGLLGFIRKLQRAFDTAIVLVHHSSKKSRSQPGQALRGSSDLHAFGDSNVYLTRKNDHIILATEHRTKPPSDPIELHLVRHADNINAHLEVIGDKINPSGSLEDRVRNLLKKTKQLMTRTEIRKELRVNNQRLGETLSDLESSGFITRTRKGWRCSVIAKPPGKSSTESKKKISPVQLSLF